MRLISERMKHVDKKTYELEKPLIGSTTKLKHIAEIKKNPNFTWRGTTNIHTPIKTTTQEKMICIWICWKEGLTYNKGINKANFYFILVQNMS